MNFDCIGNRRCNNSKQIRGVLSISFSTMVLLFSITILYSLSFGAEYCCNYSQSRGNNFLEHTISIDSADGFLQIKYFKIDCIFLEERTCP